MLRLQYSIDFREKCRNFAVQRAGRQQNENDPPSPQSQADPSKAPMGGAHGAAGQAWEKEVEDIFKSEPAQEQPRKSKYPAWRPDFGGTMPGARIEEAAKATE